MSILVKPPTAAIESDSYSWNAWFNQLYKHVTNPITRLHLSASQTGLVSGVNTQIAFDVVDIDTHTHWSLTTFQHQPLISGYYRYYCMATIIETASNNHVRELQIVKNGAPTAVTTHMVSNGDTMHSIMAEDILMMNGTTDYVEFYIYHDSGADKSLLNSLFTIATVNKVSG